MIYKTKEELYNATTSMLSNAANDEKCYNMEHRTSFRVPSDVIGVILEELKETQEALEETQQSIWRMFEEVRLNSDKQTTLKSIYEISIKAGNTMYEAMQIRAVALKALEQLGRDWDGNEG